MALIDGGRRTATVKAAIKSEVIRLDGEAFRRLLDGQAPAAAKRRRPTWPQRQNVNAFIESRKDSFSGVVDMYSQTAKFLVDNGIGEATDVLLIDENLCVGCDNCEKACADSHDGLSRLDREAGRTYAHLHVPTSCRHCEHPHCMADCPPNAIHRGPDGEVFIDDTCIGCGNCQRNCPYGVIRMDSVPPKKPGLLELAVPRHRARGRASRRKKWRNKHAKPGVEKPKKAIKCDMCSGIEGGPACVRACPTGAAIRVAPEEFLTVARLERGDAVMATAGIGHDPGGGRAGARCTTASCATRDSAGSRSRSALSLVAILAYALIDAKPRPNGGSWYGYTLGTIGALLILWLTAARPAQAGDDARALVAQGVDLRACLSRPQPDRDRHAAHRLPVRLERPHAGLCADDAGDPVGHLRHRRLCDDPGGAQQQSRAR